MGAGFLLSCEMNVALKWFVLKLREVIKVASNCVALSRQRGPKAAASLTVLPAVALGEVGFETTKVAAG